MAHSAVCAAAVRFLNNRFAGKERDPESGNDYFEARYYTSTTGRFVSPDPSGLVYADQGNPQSLNFYGYVVNRPLNYIDPSGLALELVCTGPIPDSDSYNISKQGKEQTVVMTGHISNCTVNENRVGKYMGVIPLRPLQQMMSSDVVA